MTVISNEIIYFWIQVNLMDTLLLCAEIISNSFNKFLKPNHERILEISKKIEKKEDKTIGLRQGSD